MFNLRQSLDRGAIGRRSYLSLRLHRIQICRRIFLRDGSGNGGSSKGGGILLLLGILALILVVRRRWSESLEIDPLGVPKRDFRSEREKIDC